MPPRKTPPTDDTPVEELWNLSDKTAGWLRAEGIATHGDLVDADLLELWASLKGKYRQVTRLMFYALWGARENRHWKECPEKEKGRLGELIEAMKR